MTLTSAAILLFFVMDPIGNIPLFLAALKPLERLMGMGLVATAVQMFLDGVHAWLH